MPAVAVRASLVQALLAVAVEVQRAAHEHDPAVAHRVDVLAGILSVRVIVALCL